MASNISGGGFLSGLGSFTTAVVNSFTLLVSRIIGYTLVTGGGSSYYTTMVGEAKPGYVAFASNVTGYSYDGYTWITKHSPAYNVSGNEMNRNIATNGNVYLRGTYEGMMQSTNGVDWTYQDSESIYGIVYVGNYFIKSLYTGLTYLSQDGHTWTQTSLPGLSYIFGTKQIVYFQGHYVYADSASVYKTQDFMSYSILAENITQGYGINLLDISPFHNELVAVYYNGSQYKYLWTNLNTTFTNLTLPGNYDGPIYAIASSGKYYYISGNAIYETYNLSNPLWSISSVSVAPGSATPYIFSTYSHIRLSADRVLVTATFTDSNYSYEYEYPNQYCLIEISSSGVTSIQKMPKEQAGRNQSITGMYIAENNVVILATEYDYSTQYQMNASYISPISGDISLTSVPPNIASYNAGSYNNQFVAVAYGNVSTLVETQIAIGNQGESGAEILAPVDVYTVPAGKTTSLYNLDIINTSSYDITVDLWIVPPGQTISGANNELIDQFISPNSTYSIPYHTFLTTDLNPGTRIVLLPSTVDVVEVKVYGTES